MSSKKRNLISLILVVFICAVMAFLNADRNRKRSINPNQLVVETRYSEPWTDQIGIRRGEERLFSLPKSSYRWGSGSKRAKVLAALGDPQFELSFMDEPYYVWDTDARYDWDLEHRYSGRYLILNFNFTDSVDSATVSKDLPLDAKPFSGFEQDEWDDEWDDDWNDEQAEEEFTEAHPLCSE